MKIAAVIGAEPGGDDLLWHAWARHVPDLHVMGRIDPRVHFGQAGRHRPTWWRSVGEVQAAYDALDQAADVRCIYDAMQALAVTDADPHGVERWLGRPLDELAQRNHLWKDARDRDTRPRPERVALFARIVAALRAWLEEIKPRALVMSFEANALHKCAVAVARRLDIPVLGTLASRFPERGMMMLWGMQEPHPQRPLADIGRIQALYEGEGLVTYPKPTPRQPSPLRRLQNMGAVGRYRRAVAQVHPEELLIVPPYSPVAARVRGWQEKRSARALRRRATGLPASPYVLFPLHFARDAQLSVREPFMDQWRLVQDIHRSLPSGIALAVKPHPHYGGADVGADQARAARRMGIHILHPDTGPREAIEGASVVVSLNSTLGLEALVQGTPVVTFGHDMYSRDDVAWVVRDRNTLPAVLAEALGHPDAKQDAATAFVRRLHAAVVPMHANGYTPMGDDEAERFGRAVVKTVLEGPR